MRKAILTEALSVWQRYDKWLEKRPSAHDESLKSVFSLDCYILIMYFCMTNP